MEKRKKKAFGDLNRESRLFFRSKSIQILNAALHNKFMKLKLGCSR